MERTRVTDIDPEDELARVALLEKLVATRIRLGMTKTQVGRLKGTRTESQFDFEGRTNWRVLTIGATARALDCEFRMEVVGLPEPPPSANSVILNAIRPRSLADRDLIHSQLIKERLISTRYHLNISGSQLVGSRAKSKSLPRWENSDRDTWVSTLQRYARQLGGRLYLHLDGQDETLRHNSV